MAKDLGYLAQDISILHRQYYKDTSRFFRALGLNPTAACILLTINDKPGSNQRTVVTSLVIDKALATREINKMQELGYLSKKPGIGNSYILNLTEKGRSIIPKIQKIRSDWSEKLLRQNNLSPQSPMFSAIDKIVDMIVNKQTV